MYKIAIATNNGQEINESFRKAEVFLIYQADEAGQFSFLEKRLFNDSSGEDTGECGDCGKRKGHGCSGHMHKKVELLQDCRCVLVSEIGAKMIKQFEKKAITCFVYEGEIHPALRRITLYYQKVDHHMSLIGFSEECGGLQS